VKETQALPAEKQIEAVSKKLMELNPGFHWALSDFDTKAPPKIEDGIVTELGFWADAVTDLSPVRALAGLKSLSCYGGGAGNAKLSDLSPLHGMSLRALRCGGSKVSDLKPVEGMPLTSLFCSESQVSDLSPLLQCKDLSTLNVRKTQVTPAQVAALQKALPNCKIDWDDPSKPLLPPGEGARRPDEGAKP
jgi:hypothetical protein